MSLYYMSDAFEGGNIQVLLQFLARKTAVTAVILALLALFTGKAGVAAAFGVLLGAFVSLYRTRLFGLFLGGIAITGGSGKKAVFCQALSQLMLLGLLTAAVIADLRLFLGVAAGLLILPLIICANAVTERLGITRNSWGGETEAAVWKK